MKRKYKVIGLVLGSLVATYSLVCTSFPFFPDKSKSMSDEDCLIKTSWQQMGGFERYAPGSKRLGCWSTALAQIVYFHRLRPFGRAQYTTSRGDRIDERFESIGFDLDRFESTISSTTDPEISLQMAHYNYMAAVVVQKDFGTERYMNKLASSELFERHFKVRVNRFIAWRSIGPSTLGKLEKIIYTELNAKRPVFLHFANLSDFGHSVVVDGYRYVDGRFVIHINQGQGGQDDGWYDFYKGILRPDDNALRVVYTFKPI